jgi:hypothetical protein
MADTPFNDENVADILSGFRENLPELAKESLDSPGALNDVALTTFQNLLQKFNEKHNLDLKVNFASFFDNMSMLQDGNNRKLLELYISETWQDFRTIFFLRILQCLVILADKIAAPERLGDMSTTVEQDMALIDKLFEFINKISVLGRDIGIFDVNAELTRLHKLDAARQGTIDRTSPEVRKLLDTLRTSLGYDNKQDNNTSAGLPSGT